MKPWVLRRQSAHVQCEAERSVITRKASPDEAIHLPCHPERSEGSLLLSQILRCAQNDGSLTPSHEGGSRGCRHEYGMTGKMDCFANARNDIQRPNRLRDSRAIQPCIMPQRAAQAALVWIPLECAAPIRGITMLGAGSHYPCKARTIIIKTSHKY